MSMYNDIISGTTNIGKVHKVVVSLSGGLDSTTLLYLMVEKFGKENVYALSYNYHQKHNIELVLAKRTCEKLGVQHKIIDIGFLGDIVSGVSAMVKNGLKTPTIEDVNAAKEVSTYVPFRNMILSSLTLAFAESVGADGIALGVQYGDYENNEAYYYWDCSKSFTEAIQSIADLNDKHKITFIAPFVSLTKKEEILLGEELGVNYGDTWTCYKGAEDKTEEKYVHEPVGGRNIIFRHHYQPCNVCPSCVGRAEAFAANNLIDPCVKFGVWDKEI